MRFVVVGAGAVGSAVGGLLADAGYDVLLVARGDHGRAMQAHGLRLATPDRVVELRPEVVEDIAAASLERDDVLMLAMKSQDTVTALDVVVRQSLGGEPAADVLPVVCLQNGVANERMAARRCARVYGIVVMMPAVMIEPGRVEAQGSPYAGLLDIGCWPSGTDETAEQIATALRAAGFVSRATPDVMRWKYAKLLRNLGNALEALAGNDLDDEGLSLVMDLDRRMRHEAESCLRAAGIDWVPDDEWTAHRRDQVQHAEVEGRRRSGGSSWQSLARGSGSIEADYLNGEIALLGREYGVPTPVNIAVQHLANDAARRGLRPGSMTPHDLAKGILGG